MPEPTRRDLMKAGAGTASALIAGGGILLYSSDAAVAATGLSVSDVSVSSSDGKLKTLTFSPEITVNWDGQASTVAEIHATWYVKTSSTSETTVGNTPYSISVSQPSKSGTKSHSFSEISLLSRNGGALSKSNFEATTDGGSNSTDVTLSMDLKLKDTGSNTIVSKTDILGPKPYTVTVHNTESSVSTSGTANTDGS